MAYVHYRDHTIVSSGLYDDVSGHWKLTACISWQATGIDYIQFLKNSPETFSRFEDAESAGIDYSMKWIDRKLCSSVLP